MPAHLPDFFSLSVPGDAFGRYVDAHGVPDFFVSPVVANAAGLVFLCLVIAWWPACRALRSDNPPESPWAQGGLRFLAVWLPCFAATVAVNFACRFLRVEPAVQPVLGQFAEGGPWERILLAFHGIALAPLYEEVIFRKWLQDFMVRRTGLRAGIALTTLAFVLLHCSWQAALPLAILAVALSVARMRTGSLIPCIVMHVLHNASVFLFLGLAMAIQT